MKTKKKKSPVPNGLSFYRTTGGIRWRIFKSGRKVGAATESYKNLEDARANLETHHRYSMPYHIIIASGAYKRRKKK